MKCGRIKNNRSKSGGTIRGFLCGLSIKNTAGDFQKKYKFCDENNITKSFLKESMLETILL